MQHAYAITCPSLTNYASSIISCVSSCPSNSQQIDNKCLAINQYMDNGQVHLCLNGYVSSDHSICCRDHQYPLRLSDNSFVCLKCEGWLYSNGKLCCGGSTYADFSSGSGVCTNIGTGACSSIKMTEQFKVCCPSQQYYHIELKTCLTSSGSYNCDHSKKICCNSNEKLDYVGD